MKLIFINRYFYPDHSASSQLLTDLTFHLAGRGNNVHVLTSRQRYGDAQACLALAECIRGVQVHRLWTSRFGRGCLLGRAVDYLSFYISADWYLLGLLRRGDIVVAKTDPPLVSLVYFARA